MTAAEYAAAFKSFQQCVVDSGGSIANVSTDPETGEKSYSVGHDIGTPSNPLTGTAEGRCYAEQFSWIELAYSTMNPDVLDVLEQREDQRYASVLRPCLAANGVDTPERRPVTDSDAYSTIIETYMDLVAAGKCDAG